MACPHLPANDSRACCINSVFAVLILQYLLKKPTRLAFRQSPSRRFPVSGMVCLVVTNILKSLFTFRFLLVLFRENMQQQERQVGLYMTDASRAYRNPNAAIGIYSRTSQANSAKIQKIAVSVGLLG